MKLDLADDDFEAYAPGSSRAARSVVKRRLSAWMRGVAARLAEEGIHLDVSTAKDEQSVSLGRSGGPQVQLRIDEAALTLALTGQVEGFDAGLELEPGVMGVRTTRAKATRPHALTGWWETALTLGRMVPCAAAGAAMASSSVGPRRAKRQSSMLKVEPGAHVRALSGPFAGQAGVVQELDGKGAARVLFGLLAARVSLQDLALPSRRRPVISSSHRKPTT
jgi:hypothetical protein